MPILNEARAGPLAPLHGGRVVDVSVHRDAVGQAGGGGGYNGRGGGGEELMEQSTAVKNADFQQQQHRQQPGYAQHSTVNGTHHFSAQDASRNGSQPNFDTSSSRVPRADSTDAAISASTMPTTAASLMREGPRDFTVIRDVGDGSFGTVCLADWKSPLPSGTMLSPMQHPTTRPEYIGKRLVAIKKMKKPFPNWEECMKLKELKSLLAIPAHPNLIPLYDAFLMPGSKELHFVFECMEGNLYQLTKSRKGRPLAGGLIASIFQQIVRGLHHIHLHGYFHRDMKPENLLITTTGLADYPSSSPLAMPGTPPEKDVLVIVKLADFGLARETNSRPPYTEYVSTRWYRAPEVLLRSRDYSNPVDLWALGTIMAEIVNLKPLFPGQSEVDQVLQICEVLGDPMREYGIDERGRRRGGGEWQRGIKMARAVGFEFPMAQPITFSTLFHPKIPPSLIDCIQDMLRYDPRARLTTHDLLEHYYYTTLAPRLQPPQARAVVSATTPEQQATMMRQMPRAHVQSLASISSTLADAEAANARRAVPPSHSAVSQTSKLPFGAGPQPVGASQQALRLQQEQQRKAQGEQFGDDDMAMDIASPSGAGNVRENRESSMSRYPAFPESVSIHGADDVAMELPAHRQDAETEHISVDPRTGRHVYHPNPQGVSSAHQHAQVTQSITSTQLDSITSSELELRENNADGSNETISSKDRARKPGKGWGLNISSVLGNKGAASSPSYPDSQQQQQQMQGLGVPSSASNSSMTPAQQIIAAEHTKTQASSTPAELKKARKEAEKAAREAEKAKRAAQEKAARERARAVMQKRNQILASSNSRDQVEWLTLAENDMTKALQVQQSPQNQAQSPTPSLPSQSFGQMQSAAAYAQMHSPRPPMQTQYQQQPQYTQPYSGGQLQPSGQTFGSISEKAWGKQPRVSHTGNSDHSSFSSRLAGGADSYNPLHPSVSGRGKVRPREEEDGAGGVEIDPRRQSIQSYHTRDSDPGPLRGPVPEFSLQHGTYRPETTSSLNSAPSVVDAASSYRARLAGGGGDRSSVDTRSVASSLDNQLILNMENMTAAESNSNHNHRQMGHGSPSPGPIHSLNGGGGTRPSYSRQSLGSRTGSAHRGGSASPLHHTPAPRFHPYSATSNMAGSASLSNPNVPLPSSTYPLPSLASIANSSGSEMMENLQNDASSTVVGVTRPRSKTRRPSHGAHSLSRGISRGSAASRDGSLRHTAAGTNTMHATNAVYPNGSAAVNPIFNVGGASHYAPKAAGIPSSFLGSSAASSLNGNGMPAIVDSATGIAHGRGASALSSPGIAHHTTVLPPFAELAAQTKVPPAEGGYYYSAEGDLYDG